jgi:hypothetical protein
MTTSLVAQMNPEQTLTVSMPRSLWQALLRGEPMDRETYTDEGLAIFNAFQQVRQQTGIGYAGA